MSSAWAAFVFITALPAAGVALFQSDRRRRADTLRVLRIVLGTSTALGGIGTVLIKLHEAGLV